MALTAEQQALELISRAKRILVVSRETAPTDALCSTAALFAFLKKWQKPVDAVLPGFLAAEAPAFLGDLTKEIHSDAGAMRTFELALDTSRIDLEEVQQELRDGKLVLTLVPKSGEWTTNDVTLNAGQDRYDLVIAVDCQDRESLGGLFRTNTEFFYRVPIINIDRDPGNEHWGHLNLVDLTAVSTTEILHRFFNDWNRNLMDERIATALLAGMIAKTRSFRTMNVTPKTLQTASQLIAAGAKREEIVHGLWRTRSISTLKLWGLALSRLEQDEKTGIVWSTLTKQDFLSAQAKEADVEGIVDELIGYAPEAKIMALFLETNVAGSSGLHVVLTAQPPYSAMEIGRRFQAHGTRDRAEFPLPGNASLVETVNTTVEELKKAL